MTRETLLHVSVTLIQVELHTVHKQNVITLEHHRSCEPIMELLITGLGELSLSLTLTHTYTCTHTHTHTGKSHIVHNNKTFVWLTMRVSW